ncbi:unnamed protein product [Alopecurus aequalis]
MTLLESAAGGCIIFVVSAVGGSGFYFVKGCSSSSSKACRLAGGVQALITNGPRVRRGAAWFAVLSTMESMLYANNVQGPMKQTIAWGTANALFSMHPGKPAAVRSGLKGAAWGATVGMAFLCINASLDVVESRIIKHSA